MSNDVPLIAIHKIGDPKGVRPLNWRLWTIEDIMNLQAVCEFNSQPYFYSVEANTIIVQVDAVNKDDKWFSCLLDWWWGRYFHNIGITTLKEAYRYGYDLGREDSVIERAIREVESE